MALLALRTHNIRVASDLLCTGIHLQTQGPPRAHGHQEAHGRQPRSFQSGLHA